jgi:hypothetical protein
VDLANSPRRSEIYAPSRPDKSIRELLTIHKAKGLQFDTVIVPGLERVAPRRQAAAAVVRRPAPPRGCSGAGCRHRCAAERAVPVAREPRQQSFSRNDAGCSTSQRPGEALAAPVWNVQAKDQEEGPTLVRPPSSVVLGMLWPVVEHEFAARLRSRASIEGEAPLTSSASRRCAVCH